MFLFNEENSQVEILFRNFKYIQIFRVVFVFRILEKPSLSEESIFPKTTPPLFDTLFKERCTQHLALNVQH